MSDVVVGKKRRRKSSTTKEGTTKKRRRKSSTSESKDEIILEDPSSSISFPEKKKTRYEQFATNPRYEEATGPSIVELDEIQNDNVELWLFQFPKNFSISNLNGVTVDLKQKPGSNEIGKIETEGDNSFYFYESQSKEHFKLINIFPSADNTYRLGKPFVRQVNMIESISLPEKNTEMPEKKRVEQETKLVSTPFQPFGCDGEVQNLNSVSITVRKKKRVRNSLGIGTPKKPTKKKSSRKSATPSKPKRSQKKSK